MSLSVSQSAQILTVFLSFRRNLNSKLSVIICRDSCGMTKWMLIFNADFSVNEKLKGVFSPDCSGNPAVRALGLVMERGIATESRTEFL